MSRPLFRWIQSSLTQIPSAADQSFLDGGLSYERGLATMLEAIGNLSVSYLAFDEENRVRTPTRRLLEARKLRGAADLWLLDPVAAATVNLDHLEGRKVALVYHIDNRFSKHKLRYSLLERRFRGRLQELDGVITISDFWARKMSEWGARQVFVLHNFIELPVPRPSPSEREEWRREFGFDGRTAICIGRASFEKGADIAYDALAGSNYLLFTTGRRDIQLSCDNYDFPYRDYIRILGAADALVAMSRMQEGWCRQVHEALMIGTPATGSGSGGMRELLEGAGMPVCADSGGLSDTVASLVSRKGIHETPSRYVQGFTKERLAGELANVLEELKIGFHGT